MNTDPKSNDVSWMDVTLSTTVIVIKYKLGQFEHAESIPEWPAGSLYAGIIIYYLIYLPAPFLRGRDVDLEGSSTF